MGLCAWSVFSIIFIVISLANGQASNGSTNVVQKNIELSPVVNLKSGDLRGKVLLSRDGTKYYAFLGIPYASPPIHNLRFRPPSTALHWPGILNATNYGSKCIQYNRKTKTVEGDEDCLTINVFVKQQHLKAGVKLQNENEEDEDEIVRYPVLVFVHGGEFSHGSASDYSAKYFMDEPVLLVTFNYRLNVFGFLNTGEKESQGNMGLKDIVVALKWVQDNIASFGGDPNRVVLFGSNSGAAAVHYLMLQTLNRRLFHGAIAQSGSALSPKYFSRNPKKTARKLGALSSCPTSDMLELTFCLQGKDAAELAQKSAQIYEWNNHPAAPFGPSVETTFDDNDKFLTASPYHLVSQKQESEVPLILGVNEDEGLFEAASVLVNPQLRSELNVDWHRIAPSNLYYRDTALEPDAVSNQIRTFYFGGGEISYDTRKNLSNLYSDRFVLQGTRNTALLQSRINEAKPIYIYYFTYRNHNSVLNSLGVGEKLETTNGDELQYLFHIPSQFPEIKKTDPTASFSKKLIHFVYVQFAESGKVEKTWSKTNVTWSPISPSEVKGDTALKYFKIDEDPSVISEPFLERMNFWERLPLREYTGEETISPYFRNNPANDNDDDYDRLDESFFRLL